MVDEVPCQGCGAEVGAACAPYCILNRPTEDELAQDAADVGTL